VPAQPARSPRTEAEPPAALRFTTPFYYRRPGHPFRVSLLLDPEQLASPEELTLDYTLPDSLHIEPAPRSIPVAELTGVDRLGWTLVGDSPGTRGEITARAGSFWAWCEVVLADRASPPRPEGPTSPRTHRGEAAAGRDNARRSPRDHGEDLFAAYELRYLPDVLDRAVYRPDDRTIIINTGAPTVQLYLDGRPLSGLGETVPGRAVPGRNRRRAGPPVGAADGPGGRPARPPRREAAHHQPLRSRRPPVVRRVGNAAGGQREAPRRRSGLIRANFRRSHSERPQCTAPGPSWFTPISYRPIC
jgi:hypothetical protein